MLLFLTGCATAPPGSKGVQEIYDPRANGEQLLTAGLGQAQSQGKRVLLDLGANWCSDSQAMARLLQSDPAIHRELQRHFILVMVDVNQNNGANRNPELIARFGNPIGHGIPVLLILAPDGTLLNRDPAERLRDDAYTAPETVLAYLRKWTPPPPGR
jgi:thiol:disulfide interchange protein